MAKLQFSRNAKVYITNVATSPNFVWSIPVLDGFSFSQATNSSEITLNEMADSSGNSRRGRQMFNDSYAPAEWSFSTYIRPFVSAGAAQGLLTTSAATSAVTCAVEEILWAQMVGTGAYTAPNFANLTKANAATGLDISFANSNKVTLGTFDLLFSLGEDADSPVYKIEGCCVNEASIDFDIDGIATINWSGMGKIVKELESPEVIRATAAPAAGATGQFWFDTNQPGYPLHVSQSTGVGTNWKREINEGASDTDTGNFIRNRLTSLTMVAADSTLYPGTTIDGVAGNYSTVITGGNVTISNNMTFLTPETLGIVNQPLGHVTGTRSIGGNFTCYLNMDAGSSADLFEDIIENTADVTNSFDLTFGVGGTTSNTSRVELHMETCHLEVPTHSMDDVISLEVNFHALPSTIGGTNELKVKYFGTTL